MTQSCKHFYSCDVSNSLPVNYGWFIQIDYKVKSINSGAFLQIISTTGVLVLVRPYLLKYLYKHKAAIDLVIESIGKYDNVYAN